MKKSIFQILIIFSAVLLIFFACPQTDTENKENPQTLSSAKAITSFSFASLSAIGIINETNHTIVVTVPFVTNVSALTASFTATGVSVKVGLTLQTSGSTENNFTGLVTYTVTAEDASAQDYTVIVMFSQLANVTTAGIAGNLTFTVNIAGTSARGGGNVTDQGASAVTERGLCWNTTGSPAISGTHAADGLGTGVFTNASITGLDADTIYFVRAYASNSYGTSYGNEITFSSGKTFGTDYAGGYVFHNNGSGGGLLSAKSDQSSSQAWIAGGTTQTTLNGNTLTAIGSGLTNSNAIIAQIGHTGSAAKVCLDYNDGVYSDWFLSSKDELYLMYSKLKLIGIGNFTDMGNYLSSSEYASNLACYQNFVDGSQGNINKSSTVFVYVRAVRAF